jgi:3-isopropylmalate dehydrogenase
LPDKRIILLPGDGIGPEVTAQAIKVFAAVEKRFGVTIEYEMLPVGGTALEQFGAPITDETMARCKEADAVLLGAVGDPRWDNEPADKRPEAALLRLRAELELFTNLRPVHVFEALKEASSLKPEVVRGIDLLVVRELTGGIYFGKPSRIERVGGEERAVDTMVYRASEIERIARVAFEAARRRRKKVTSVDKANILATSQLWRKTVSRVAADYPDVELLHYLVDNCAMQLVRHPRQFDVILTENMFGDILSDEAAMLTGSLGMLPSASLGIRHALYEPVHGSAPDIAGQNKANPLATIGSVAMMFRHSFQMEEVASSIENSVEKVLAQGYRTADIYTPGTTLVGTEKMGDLVAGAVG